MKSDNITSFTDYKENKDRDFAERLADLAERYESYDPMAVFYQLDHETNISQKFNIENSRKLHEEFMALAREDNFRFLLDDDEDKNSPYYYKNINEDDYDDEYLDK